jgi:hypothetical protein
MFYTEDDEILAQNVSETLFLAQKEFLKRHSEDINKKSPDFLEKFTQFINMYNNKLDFPLMKSLSKTGAAMYKLLI